MSDPKTEISKIIKRYVEVEEKNTEVKLVGSMYNLRNSAAELLLRYGRGEISELEFDERWSGLERIFLNALVDAGEAYLRKVREAVYKGKESLKK